MFRTILVPVDLTEHEITRAALKKAEALAEWTGAALRLLNVQVVRHARCSVLVVRD
mgnify:CR=1 FL=1